MGRGVWREGERFSHFPSQNQILEVTRRELGFSLERVQRATTSGVHETEAFSSRRSGERVCSSSWISEGQTVNKEGLDQQIRHQSHV